MRELFLSVAVLLLTATLASAGDPCTNIPGAARAYLKAHPGWKILGTSDLIDDDKKFWRQYHKADCPGFAEVDLDGSGRKFTALALLRTAKSGQKERVIIVRANRHRLETRTIHPDFKVPSYVVVWRAAPGITWAWDEPDRKIRIPHDSLVAATLEAAAQQFYLKDGKLVHVQTSD